MKRDLPSHIKKAFKAIATFLPIVDLLIELLDARMPISSRLSGFIEATGKPFLIVLGKADLADPFETARWCRFFEDSGQPCVSFCSKESKSVNELVSRIFSLTSSHEGAKFRRAQRIMVVGIPNVGKSSLINALAKRRATRVANIPGVTRNIQWVKLSQKFELLDLPGILDFSLLRKGNFLQLINSIKDLDDDPEAVISNLCRELLEAGLSHILPGFHEAGEHFPNFLSAYAKQLNFLSPKGEPDTRRAAFHVLKKFRSAGFGAVSFETVKVA